MWIRVSLIPLAFVLTCKIAFPNPGTEPHAQIAPATAEITVYESGISGNLAVCDRSWTVGVEFMGTLSKFEKFGNGNEGGDWVIPRWRVFKRGPGWSQY